MDYAFLRRIFRALNRYFMVPAYRLGLGPLLSNPLTSYIMVLKTVGRKSGRLRYAPVNYAILDGNLYCLAGFGEGTHWYRNLQTNPRLEVLLPGRTIAGTAETVSDAAERLAATRQVLRNAGWAAFLEGWNPFTITDEELVEKSRHLPVVRIRPSGLAGSAYDPGGWFWVLVWGLTLAWLFGRGKRRRG